MTIFQGPFQSLAFCDSVILSFHRLQISLILHAEAKHREHGLFQSTKTLTGYEQLTTEERIAFTTEMEYLS